MTRPRRIAVVGSQRWSDQAFIALAIGAWIEEQGHTIGSISPLPVIVHGGAPGADSIAGRIARNWGWREEIHAADWGAVLASGVDVVLAFPLGESLDVRDCMAAAVRAGIPVLDCAAAVGW